jgi:2-polyprenyl-3-methyl-5-hydroxy-6-metoxy-1,4-benzoquinol methylase
MKTFFLISTLGLSSFLVEALKLNRKLVFHDREFYSIDNNTEEAQPNNAAAKAWWNNSANEGFQHIDREYVQKTMAAWQAFLPHYQWTGKRVLDYGIGAGYLGEVLFQNPYFIKSYVGVDISQKALDAAGRNLAPYAPNFQLLLTPQNFQALTPQVFVSQQVIQHFPSVAYLDQFLANVDSSGAPEVMLQFRMSSDGATTTNYAYQKDNTSHGDVAFALVTSANYIGQKLPHYQFLWSEKRPMCCGTTGQYTGWKRSY